MAHAEPEHHRVGGAAVRDAVVVGSWAFPGQRPAGTWRGPGIPWRTPLTNPIASSYPPGSASLTRMDVPTNRTINGFLSMIWAPGPWPTAHRSSGAVEPYRDAASQCP